MLPLGCFTTFSTYHKKKLFKDEVLYQLFMDSLNRAQERYAFVKVAYVVLPNHVHLLLQVTDQYPLSDILRAIKQPFSHRALQYLPQHYPGTYETLRVEHAGKVSYWFWQAGGGDRRAVRTHVALISAEKYIQLNPVRLGLVLKAEDWPWSSPGGVLPREGAVG